MTVRELLRGLIEELSKDIDMASELLVREGGHKNWTEYKKLTKDMMILKEAILDIERINEEVNNRNGETK